jgi:hypothetical protein
VYGNTYAFPGTAYINIPQWYQYCLGINVPRNLVNFTINGVPVATNQIFQSINSPNGQILESKIFVFNKMFSYVNLFSTELDLANTTGLGDVVAWRLSNWNRTRLPGRQSRVKLSFAAISFKDYHIST